MSMPTPANQVPYPTTGSSSTVNKTLTSLSTMIIIKVNNTPVGAVKKIDVNEDRSVEMVDEVGHDGHVDSAPTRSTNISGNCTRTRFDGLRIAEAFSRGFIHVHSQRIPFDIHIIDTMQGDEASGASIVTVIQNVWITQIQYGYDADNWIISDTMQWKAENIFSYMAGTGMPVANGGIRKLANIDYDPYELAADIGNRGTMDAPNLLNATWS